MYNLKVYRAHLIHQQTRRNFWKIKSYREKYRDLLKYIKDTFKEEGPEYSDDILLKNANAKEFNIVLGVYREYFLIKEISILVDVKQYNEFNGDIRLCKFVLDEQASYNADAKVYHLVFPTIGEKTLSEI